MDLILISDPPPSSSDLISFSEGDPPAPPPGCRQLSTPQTQAPFCPPRCSPHEEVGSNPQTSLPAESAIKFRPAAVRRGQFWSGTSSLQSNRSLFGRGGGQPAGASETRLVGSVRGATATAAAAGGGGNTASSAASACRVHPSPSLRSPGSALGHSTNSPCCRPPKQPLFGLHLSHAGLDHLPLQSLTLLLVLHQLHAPLRLPVFLLLLLLFR